MLHAAVFPRVRHACYSEPMTPLEEQPQQTHTVQSAATYRRIATLFLALTVGVVGLAAYVVFSRAEVIVMSKQEEVKADFIIDVARMAGNGEVRGDVLELSESMTSTFPSASVVTIDAPSEGTVKIVSTMSRAQTLVATTRLLTADDRLFRIRDTVTVPAHGFVTVAAFSTEAGVKGAAPAGTSFSIPGLNPESQKLFTTIAVATFVGEKKDVRMVTQQDVDKAVEVLRDKLVAELGDKMRIAAKEGLSSEDAEAKWGEFIDVTETSRVTSVPVGSDAPEFTLTIGIKATGVFYDEKAFDAEVSSRLGDRVMDGRTLHSVDAASVKKEVEKRDLVAGRINVRVTASGLSIMSTASPALEKSKLIGIKDDAAKTYLESIDGVASASIKTSPFWMHRMPNVAEHISVEVR